MADETPSGEVLTREEILVCLSAAAKKGNVPAMRLLLEELRIDGIEKPSEQQDFIDELAKKREIATAV